MGRRGKVRVSHAEIDDVGTGIARGRLGAVDLFEDVRRQTADAVKIFHGTLQLRQPSPTAISRDRFADAPLAGAFAFAHKCH